MQINADNDQKEPNYNKYNIRVINKENSIKFIDLDIERTFSYLGIFSGNSPLSEDLREILRAFVVSRPDIGYVISFNIGTRSIIYSRKFINKYG